MCHFIFQNSAYTEKAEGNLVSETNPLSTHGDLKQEVPSVPLHCPDVKVDATVSYGIVCVYLFGSVCSETWDT
jgi:hypothetical protein